MDTLQSSPPASDNDASGERQLVTPSAGNEANIAAPLLLRIDSHAAITDAQLLPTTPRPSPSTSRPRSASSTSPSTNASPPAEVETRAGTESIGTTRQDARLDGTATTAAKTATTSEPGNAPHSSQVLVRRTVPPAIAQKGLPEKIEDKRSKTSIIGRASSSSPSLDQSKSLAVASLDDLPNEVLLHILGFLDVNDLLATSRTSHHLRCLCVAPILHILRRRRTRAALAPLVAPGRRPPLADLIARSIFLTHTTVVSRKLARSLAAIRLQRRLAVRPPAHVLVERCVLPPECAPGIGHVAPALAARTRAVERERLKDGLRRWVGAVWQREVGRRGREQIRRCEERGGTVGKVWRLRKFWERVGRGGSS